MTTITIDHLYKAQFGEDRILWQVFRQRTSGYFIEIGAYDGVSLSNTYFLEQMGWCGMLVEAIPQLCDQARRVRPRSRVVQAAVSKPGHPPSATFTIANNVPVLSFLTADDEHVARCKREGAKLVEIEVPVVTVDELLCPERENPSTVGSPWIPHVGWRIDLVSIDVEGGEKDVLDGFDLDRFRPRILLIENDRPSAKEIEPYLRDRGYRKFHRQKINDFYVRVDDPAEDLMLDGFEVVP